MSAQETNEIRRPRRWLRLAKWGCGGSILLVLGLVAGVILLLSRVPKSYPAATVPMEPPSGKSVLGGGLDGFESPYLGHTGSWNGKGGNMGGRPKNKEMDTEAAMGLRWTFMPVHWRAMEPDGPVDLDKEIPPAWRALDAFVIAAQQRKLNVLMQAPVIGGNAGGPPSWAGRREKGKSAPANMEAAAAFGAKLATRYAPGGTLATQHGWGSRYGVRAWELDNEPNSYLTHWKGQAGDYAEFVTKTAAAIRKVDPQAVIIAPAANIGSEALSWIESTLDAPAIRGSPEYRQRGERYSIGPAIDVISFHLYEGLDTAFSGKDRTIEIVFSEVRDVFERWQSRAADFNYARKEEYWHTEGNFDFLGILSRERRAAWRIQFLTRAFAAGVRKVMVMDASVPEQNAVRGYIAALPNPFPMQRVTEEISILKGTPAVFRHRDADSSEPRNVWISWALAGTGDAEVEFPVVHRLVKAVQVDGSEHVLTNTNGRVRINLQGDRKMAPPVMLIDR